ncbi:hypothetical protein AX16_009252 [Volvariella volvacea WC 439]|nr:hypothetical protein AX16_009252 [Volvariella volvacea WC 439]
MASGAKEIPYALPPKRFQDPEPLPDDYRYEQREYIRETAYAVQPRNDGQAGDSPFEDKVGRGQPTENPLFLNIVAPPAFPRARNFPVKVYIHGGFLQFGSPHSLSSQAQFISAERSEVWVNIGYRLSAFGFLACDNPPITGNFGFKDQWLALQWIRDNIDAFGGNASDIQIAGLSAGAHSVHQLLHYASHLPEGHQAPFQSAILQSNAILTDPKTPQELRPQFNALCRALQLDPESPDILETLQDPLKVPWSSITGAIETDGLRVGSIEYGTFRGCQHDSWVPTQVGHMAWQRSGAFSRGLLSSGVRSIIIGNVAEEWYLYSIAHPISSPKDIVPNLERYFQHEIVKTLVDRWTDGVLLPEDAAPEECQRLFGELLSFVQVYLPVQLLARDLAKSGYPIARYTINWIPEQCKHQGEPSTPFPRHHSQSLTSYCTPQSGYTTHGTDRVIWTLRKPELTCDQHDVAKTWLHDVAATCKALASLGKPLFGPEVALTLCPDSHIAWRKSENWEKVMDFVDILPGEGKNEGLSRL